MWYIRFLGKEGRRFEAALNNPEYLFLHDIMQPLYELGWFVDCRYDNRYDMRCSLAAAFTKGLITREEGLRCLRYWDILIANFLTIKD